MDGSIASILVIGLYFLPSIIAVARKTRSYGSVIVINFFLGWTIIGWIIALAMSVRSTQKNEAGTQANGGVGQTLPPPNPSQYDPTGLLFQGARVIGKATGRLKGQNGGRSNGDGNGSKKTPFYRQWWIWVVLGLVALLLVPKGGGQGEKVTTTSDVTNSLETVPATPWNEILKPGVVGSEIGNALCPDLTSFVTAQLQVINDRLTQSEEFMNDPFDSAAYLEKIDWESFQHEDDALSRQLEISTPALSSNSSTIPTAEQSKAFLEDTLALCGLENDAQTLMTTAMRLDTRLQSMQVKANNLPWYPKGFSTYDDEIAYRWLEPGEFSCAYGDHCWGMLITAKNGCPQSLYAEITILDSAGSNIGFTNDTTSGLSPSQQAKLIFEDFTPGARKARLSEISCY